MDKSLSLTQLNQYTLIKVSGIEAQKYLQGQVTLDVLKMQTQKLYYAAHCEPKGKVIALLMLWKLDEETFFYLVPKSLEDNQLKEIKKYAIFSKVIFEIQQQATFHYIYFADNSNIDKRKVINMLDKTSTSISLYSLTRDHNTQVDTKKFHLILDNEKELILINFLFDDTFFSELSALDINIVEENTSLFDKNQIKKGIAQLNIQSSQEFLPQALNIQALEAISFSKGCYTGQEMVARAKYRGANKRALYYLKGISSQTPKLGEGLLMRLGDNFKETGKIITFVKEGDTIFIQAVLSQGLEKDLEFKILDSQDSKLSIQELPYILE